MQTKFVGSDHCALGDAQPRRLRASVKPATNRMWRHLESADHMSHCGVSITWRDSAPRERGKTADVREACAWPNTATRECQARCRRSRKTAPAEVVRWERCNCEPQPQFNRVLIELTHYNDGWKTWHNARTDEMQRAEALRMPFDAHVLPRLIVHLASRGSADV